MLRLKDPGAERCFQLKKNNLNDCSTGSEQGQDIVREHEENSDNS